ncbi:MAG: 2Fe-2S iron-sulfur cluster binding domain-containing protein [Chlorobiota bacterium]|jgi:2Fe-2S ferredoxin|nr:2Fe-2S iron-sulfur cluster binding domain-containing protein [Chlorobiota bacterium]QQS67150.1 MAG: 2Fe-2S iron-sulfur cluster binding domain-containing protein [Chlorobiota bacterium]
MSEKKIFKVTFMPWNITVNALEGENFLDLAMQNEIDLQHNCGGVCACSTCHVIVKKGFETLSEMEDDEADQLDEAEGLTIYSRLGCQSKIYGDAVVEVPLINEDIRHLFHEGATKNDEH